MIVSTEKNKSELIRKLEAEIASNPDSSMAHARLGTALLSSGKTKKAESAFRRAIEIDPHCVPALVNLGGVLLGRWDFKGCVEVNRTAAAAKPDEITAHYNQGLGHLYLKEKEDMIACFRRVIKIDENNAGGHYYLAVGLLSLGFREEAKKEVARAMQLGYKPQPEFLKVLEKANGKQ